MNELCKKHRKNLYLSIVSSVISSLSLMAAILVNSEGENKITLFVFGALFWIGLVIEQIFFWRSYVFMKEIAFQSKRLLKGRAGIFTFAASTEGFIADVVFAISLIALVICAVFSLGETILQYILICFIVLSFRMHCILNGKSYRYKEITERKVDRKNG